MTPILLLALAALAFASPLNPRHDLPDPVVTIKNGTLVGLTQEQFGQELFLNIPYADPPKRLGRSVPVSKSFGTLQAKEYGPHCWSRVPLQTGYDDNSGYENSEDCLSLNVIRPYGVYEGQKPVPIGLFIHGGGLSTGGSADKRYNGTAYVAASVANGSPMIFVSINYRLASLGFLAGSELTDAGLLNLGIHDQRLALQWVQENIAKFGGDPSKVTIQGESSGGQSVHAHILAYGGRDDGLFSQGIIESAGPSGGFPMSTSAPYQATYNTLLANTTCSSTQNSSFADQLACIRGLDIGTFRNATALGATGLVQDGSFVQVESAFAGYGSNKYVHVPLIVGTNTDEGRSFARQGANTTEQAIAFLGPTNGSNDTAEALLRIYPSDPVLGCPFDTGSYQLSPYQNGGYSTPGRLNKQVSAIVGDESMQAGARYLGRQIGGQVPFYKYLFNHVPYSISYGISDYVGHFLEISYVFNLQNNDTAFWDTYHFTATYLGEGAPITDRGLGQYMSRSFAAFITTGNPNNANFSSKINWPKYTRDSPKQMTWRAKGSTIEEDTYREQGMDYIIQNVFLA